MRLLEDRILVLRDSSETKLDSGIIIPEQSIQKKNTGTVVEVGPGTSRSQMTVSVGERVSFGPHAGSAIDYNGKEHLIMRLSDINYVL